MNVLHIGKGLVVCSSRVEPRRVKIAVDDKIALWGSVQVRDY